MGTFSQHVQDAEDAIASMDVHFNEIRNKNDELEVTVSNLKADLKVAQETIKRLEMELRDMNQIKAENRAAKELKSALHKLGLEIKVKGSY